jgi:WhiB family redox-sensing transcriptional regulator
VGGALAYCGTRSAYVRGCRCDECREAQSIYTKEWREKNKLRGIGYREQQRRDARSNGTQCEHCTAWISHGLDSTYRNHKCRCDACSRAHADAWQDWKRARGLAELGSVRLRMADWSDRAECRDMETGLFFEADLYRQTRLICWRCSVRADCLDDALHYERDGTREGMRGGLTPAERRLHARKISSMSTSIPLQDSGSIGA